MSNHEALIIDVGSTSLKAAVVTMAVQGADPAVLFEMPLPAALKSSPSRHETDANEIVALVIEAIARAQGLHPSIERVAFSTQMHGVVLADAEDRPLSPFLSWQDERADEKLDGRESVLDRLRKKVPESLVRSTGLSLRVGVGGTILHAWLQQNKIQAKGLRVHTLGSFLLRRLGGPHVTHLTNAAPLGLVDLHEGAYNEELLDYLGLRDAELPKIVDDYAAIGQVSVQGMKPILLHPDVGDHQASLLGSGVSGGDLAISLGTAGIAARIVDAMVGVVDGVEVRPYFDGRRLLVRTRQPGGRSAEHFASAFFELTARSGSNISREEFWAAVSSASADSVWGRVCSDFLGGYTDAYEIAVTELFEGSPRPAKLRLNGGMARHIPWFSENFGRSLQMETASRVDEDLSIRGVATLLRTAVADEQIKKAAGHATH